MIATNNRIIVAVNMGQKDNLVVDGVVYRTALKWENNFREKSPVVAKVVSGNTILKEGDVLLCHHNHFFGKSPYFLMDDLFSIPFHKTIFAILKPDGEIQPVCTNVIGRRVKVESTMALPVSMQKTYIDRIEVLYGGDTKYRAGDLIFTRPNAPYDIVYNVDQVERRITKVSDDMVVGVEKKYYAKPKNSIISD